MRSEGESEGELEEHEVGKRLQEMRDIKNEIMKQSVNGDMKNEDDKELQNETEIEKGRETPIPLSPDSLAGIDIT